MSIIRVRTVLAVVTLILGHWGSAAGQDGPICGAPGDGELVSRGDSLAPVLARAQTLWIEEQRASRSWQGLFCEGCDGFQGPYSDFYASSSNLIERLANRYPTDGRALCALAEMRLRAASLGEGEYDRSLLGKVEEILVRAEEAASRPAVIERLEELRWALRTAGFD